MLSYGTDDITPAVIASPVVSVPIDIGLSIEATDPLCECLEDCDPAALLGKLGVSGIRWVSLLGLSLCNRLPKKDLPPEDCLDFGSCGALEGIVRGAAWIGIPVHSASLRYVVLLKIFKLTLQREYGDPQRGVSQHMPATALESG